jgi:hypothetical protein
LHTLNLITGIKEQKQMLINENRENIISMVELWAHKTGDTASSFLRVIDCDEGFKVGVIDYIDPDNELVTKENDQSENDAKRIRQRILEAIK